MALYVRTRTGFHLPGDVTVCENRVFRGLIESVLLIFLHFNEINKVVVLPLTRYFFWAVIRNLHTHQMLFMNHSADVLKKKYLPVRNSDARLGWKWVAEDVGV